MQESFMRWREVQHATGLSRSTIWRLERAGDFPQRRKLSTHTVGWLQGEIEHWLKSRKATGDDRELARG
jgi:prophage regulatory protein